MKIHKLPKGFMAGGAHSGIKKNHNDMAMIYSPGGCKWHALFTTNKVKAAPVLIDEALLKKKTLLKIVLVNSGNANAMTGKGGISDAKDMRLKAAKAMNVKEGEVFVSSTGIIGKKLDMKAVSKGILKIAARLSDKGLMDAALGIITTDRFIKVSSRVFHLGGKKITVTGIAKGAGMIHPNMATMLAYIMTDADITKEALKNSLIFSSDESFNSISVDGDMSTNDTVLIMANGTAGNKTIEYGTGEYKIFLKYLNEVSLDLAKMIVLDGEGAEKFITIKIAGAKSVKDAKKAARALSNSLLFKCAVHGGDPNWGRIASGIGASGIDVDPMKMDIVLDGITFVKKGEMTLKKKAKSIFKRKNVEVKINLNSGNAEARAYTCDITKAYIKFNSRYTT